LDWVTALDFCEDRGMVLVTFDSKEEIKYFTSITRTKLWAGIHDIVTEQRFVQVNDVKLPPLPWAAREPNNYDDDEHCVQIAANGQFYDVVCDLSLRFACEKVQ
jgi:hypothetical protein